MRALFFIAALFLVCPAAAQVNTTGGGMSYEDQKVLAGNGFTVSTGVQAISAGNNLYAALANTSATQSLVMTSRILACNAQTGAVVSEYLRYAPTAVLPASPTPIAATVGNRISGGPAIPATFTYNMSTGVPTGGAVTSSGFVPLNANRLEIKEIVVIPPGGKLVYSIGGSGGGLAQTARCSMTFLGYLQ